MQSPSSSSSSERPATVVAVVWDQTSRPAYSIVAGLASASTDEVGFVVPGYERTTANLLDDIVVPALVDADRVLALWSPNDPLWVGFQAGVAAGLGKPVRVVAFDGEAAAARGLPGGVATISGLNDALAAATGRSSTPDEVPFTAGAILLCPRETEPDREILRLVESSLGGREYRRLSAEGTREPAVDDVVWVVTSHEVSGGQETNLAPNLGAAFEAGRCYGATLRVGEVPQLRIVRVGVVPPVPALEHLTQPVADGAAAAGLLGASSAHTSMRVTKVVLRDLKCFSSIEVPISTDSPLEGAWTCIAGVNGAGKSTILQSIALGLLGRSSAPELGLARLARMVRRADGATSKAPPSACEIRLSLSDGTFAGELVLPLSDRGIDERRLSAISDRAAMEQLWERLRSTLIVSYGATRNISDTLAGSSTTPMSPFANRQLTLFDPLAQIVSAEALISGGPRFEPMLRTVAALATALLDEEDARFQCEVVNGKLTFRRDGAVLGSLDLPDGFRSVLALLADIAAGWHELHPDAGADGVVDPAIIEGIVLVDELDLHLHARLQRMIVPRLRRTLPKMQWIVTTHSPFIVGSFDRTEIVVLDRAEPGGIRELDRQVLAFTANDIYDWLLDARPVSEAGETAAAADGGAALLYQSPDRNLAEAEQLVAKQSEMLEQLRHVKA
jgi:hypothetical protein